MSYTPRPVGLDELPCVEDWPVVELAGERWRVAPVYLAPVSALDVERLSAELGCDVPTVALVDAIWREADLKLNPYHLTRNARIAADMVAFEAQRRAVEAAIAHTLAERGDLHPDDDNAWRLLAGSHKDTVRLANGKLGIYGWHDLSGKPIQGAGAPHGAFPGYVDYSQGYRPVRRVE